MGVQQVPGHLPPNGSAEARPQEGFTWLSPESGQFLMVIIKRANLFYFSRLLLLLWSFLCSHSPQNCCIPRPSQRPNQYFSQTIWKLSASRGVRSANLFALHITQLQGYTRATTANILTSSYFQAVLGVIIKWKWHIGMHLKVVTFHLMGHGVNFMPWQLQVCQWESLNLK